MTFLQKHSGQAVPLFALMLPVLMAMVLVALEFGERAMQRAMVEDALQQAARSAVQTFDYETFAASPSEWTTRTVLRASGECRQVQAGRNSNCAEITELAQDLFLTNLGGVRGLTVSETDLASRVRWTVLPNGGTCTFASSGYVPVTLADAPLLCAEVQAPMRGLQLLGESFTPWIAAAETLDPIR
jgi:hypothetical protein